MPIIYLRTQKGVKTKLYGTFVSALSFWHIGLHTHIHDQSHNLLGMITCLNKLFVLFQAWCSCTFWLSFENYVIAPCIGQLHRVLCILSHCLSVCFVCMSASALRRIDVFIQNWQQRDHDEAATPPPNTVPARYNQCRTAVRIYTVVRATLQVNGKWQFYFRGVRTP